MIKTVSFDNFAPRLRKGHVTPQGRRMIYETEDGEKQIVLPIEMADAILLATGKYTMRQIIEKIFKRKGSLHFRTLFKTIHQLRDHGFFENGDELENHSWWTSAHNDDQRRWHLDFSLARRLVWRRPRTLVFYFLSLVVLAASLLTVMDMPWPPLSKTYFKISGGFGWSVLMALLCASVLQTGQSLFKAVFQLLLTGNMFGLSLRISPWGVYVRAADEPTLLITNRLFLLLYHASILLAPFLLVWPLSFWDPGFFRFGVATAIIKATFDLCPFTNSLLMQSIRSMLSLGQSELVAGYLRENSLLSLLDPMGRPSINRRIYRFFTSYILLWSSVGLWICSVGLIGSSTYISLEPFSALLGWCFFSITATWVTIHLGRHMRPILIKPMLRLVGLLKGWLRSWRRAEWSREKVKETLMNLPLFSYLSPSLLEVVLAESQIFRARGGSRLITQGEIGRDLFVLLDGSLVVEKSSFDRGRMVLSTLRPVSIFGEMAIVEESERTADVITRENSTVLKIPAQVLRLVARQSQYLREIEAFRSAIMVNQFFTSAPMFKELADDTVHDITMRSSMRHCEANEYIIRQGAEGRSFFMVLRGTVEVRINNRPVKKIRQGGFFGEISLIADIPRTASVVTTESTVIMEMASVNFWEILCQNIELAMFVEAVGESRLSEDLLNGTTGLDVAAAKEKAG